uniref:Uncharacterized protein n=1 Tax=Oryza meridionalis TaxID=40149 RepID=A0A0E0BZH8_9ORYZ
MLSSGGELKSSSLVQQMVWVGTGKSSSSIMGSLSQLPCSEEQDAASSPASMLFLPQQLLHASSNSSPCLNIPEVNLSTGLHPLGSFVHGDVQQQEISGIPDQSWRQLLLGGLVGDHEKYSAATALLSKGLDDEAAASAYDFYGHATGGGGEEIQLASPEASSCKSQLSQMLLQAASSPRSCVTTSGLGSSMMEFSNTAAAAAAPELTRKHHAGQSDNSSECNSTETGSALKKARVQASSSAQSTLKGIMAGERSTDGLFPEFPGQVAYYCSI